MIDPAQAWTASHQSQRERREADERLARLIAKVSRFIRKRKG
jgi:hypothetical protein